MFGKVRVGGNPVWPTSILGGGGGVGIPGLVLPKVHIRMRVHAHVCTHIC